MKEEFFDELLPDEIFLAEIAKEPPPAIPEHVIEKVLTNPQSPFHTEQIYKQFEETFLKLRNTSYLSDTDLYVEWFTNLKNSLFLEKVAQEYTVEVLGDLALHLPPQRILLFAKAFKTRIIDSALEKLRNSSPSLEEIIQETTRSIEKTYGVEILPLFKI
ncbi:hypothetical protein [Thermodesulfovibrio hydrogeniphilus]